MFSRSLCSTAVQAVVSEADPSHKKERSGRAPTHSSCPHRMVEFCWVLASSGNLPTAPLSSLIPRLPPVRVGTKKNWERGYSLSMSCAWGKHGKYSSDLPYLIYNQ